MKKIVVLSLVLTNLLFTSCKEKEPSSKQDYMPTPTQPAGTLAATSSPDEAEKITFTQGTYPKVDGSTATIPLSEAYVSKLLGVPKEGLKDAVKHNKTHDAYVNLIKGTADIIFVTEPSADELKLASDGKVELEVIPVVKEGFVFMVNTNNPINNLTTKQVQDIYQGKIKNWKAVGGKDKEIIAYQREKNSGSQTLMEQKVMKGLQLTDEPKTIVQGMAELIEQVANYETSEKALGYSVYYYAKTMYSKDNVKLISIDGVAPDNKSISQGKYPFGTAYYAVIKKTEATDSPARKLLKWVLSKEGQNISETAGYTPLEMR